MMVDKGELQLSELLSAYLDGELNDEERAVVERTLDRDQGARRLLDELRQAVAAVAELPSRSAPVSLTEDIQAQLERRALLGDTGEVIQPASAGSRSPWSALLSMAAALAIICTGVMWYTYNPVDPMGAESTLAQKTPQPTDEFAQPKRELAAESRSKAAPGVVPIPAGRKVDEAVWLAAADVERLVAIDGRVSHLRKHKFKNENIELKIGVQDRSHARTLARKFESSLRSVSMVDAASSDEQTPLRDLAGKGFFLKGQRSVNFDGRAGEQQFLVRVSTRERDRLFSELEDWPGVDERTVLRSGPVHLRGLEASRLALAGKEPTMPSEGRFAGRLGARGETAARGRRVEASEGEVPSPQPVGGLSVIAELARVLTTPPKPKETAPSPDSNATRVALNDRHGDMPATAAKSRSNAPMEVDSVESRNSDESRVERADITSTGQDLDSSARSLVEKKMKELAPARGGRTKKVDRGSPPLAPAFDDTEAIADKSTPDFAELEEPDLEDEFVTLVFRFVPPKLPEPQTANPARSDDSGANAKPGKKRETIKK